MIKNLLEREKKCLSDRKNLLKNNKGITITSLTIYVIVATAIVLILVFLNANFFSNVNELTAKANIVSEGLDFKSALIRDLKSENDLKVTDYNNNMIKLSNNVKYEIRVLDKTASEKKFAIYRNDVQIAKNIVSHTLVDGQKVKEGPFFEYDVTSNTVRMSIKFYDGTNTYIENGTYLVGKTGAPEWSLAIDSNFVPVSGDNTGMPDGGEGEGTSGESTPDISEIPENERIYAVLYSDGLLRVGNTENVDNTKTVTKNFKEISTSINKAKPDWLAYKTSIKIIDFQGPNKIELKTAENLFSGCTNLVEIRNIQNLNTANVTNMSNMFSDCTKLETVTLNGIDVSNVTTMSDMFSGCLALRSVNLNTLTTTSLIDISNMFANCTSLESFDMTNFDTKNVTNISKMFYNCQRLQSVAMYNLEAKGLTDLSYLFYNCMNLNNFEFGNMDTSLVTNTAYMFANCVKLADVKFGSIDTSNVENMEGMFYNCQNLKQLIVENLEFNNVINMAKMFEGCLDVSEIRFAYNVDTSKVENMSSLFKNCSNLTSINLAQYNNFKTTSVTDMSEMFFGCSGITDLNVTNFDTSLVTNYKSMFEDCTNLSELKLTSFKTNVAQSFNRMFANDTKLATIFVGNGWNSDYTGVDITEMFEGCGTTVVTRSY